MNLQKALLIISVAMVKPSAVMTLHFKCRGGLYPRSCIERFPVPDDKVKWSTEYKNYKPPNHTASSIHGKPWADPELVQRQRRHCLSAGLLAGAGLAGMTNLANLGDSSFKPKWNNLDGNVNRTSYTGQYQVVDGYPLNPVGRTGICGRGVLGRWGPNHAADPVVTRWKTRNNGEKVIDIDKRPILQFIAIKRGDTGEWALPGGMVDPGEKVTTTAVREFQEEALNSFNLTEDEKEVWQAKFNSFFSGGDKVYEGYIDDRRNTDNAWMESAAYNFHDESGHTVGTLKLNAGDDAVGVQWVDITQDLALYANHADIVKDVWKKRVVMSN